MDVLLRRSTYHTIRNQLNSMRERGGMNGKISTERWNVGDFFCLCMVRTIFSGVGVL